jgi:5,10-methylenetetrahydromethanopterin reductase
VHLDILPVLAGAAYVRWGRERIAEGARRAGRDPGTHRVTTFALYAVDADAARARAAVRGAVSMFLAAERASALVRVPGLATELHALLADGEADLAARIPDRWLDEVAIAGDPPTAPPARRSCSTPGPTRWGCGCSGRSCPG